MNPLCHIFRFGLTGLVLLSLAASPASASGGGSAKKPAGHGGHAKSTSHGTSKSAAAKGHTSGGHGAKRETAVVKKEGEVVNEYEELLTMITSKDKKHDPRHFKEIELGVFKVTHPGIDGETFLIVRFHIFGVLPEQDQLAFDRALEGRQQRMRDAVLSVMQKARVEHLLDPSLDYVKADLIAAVNRVLEASLVRDIAFSNFSIEPN
jgi:hypothetical protein